VRSILLGFVLLATGCAAADDASLRAEGSDADIVGGKAEDRFSAVGYLARSDRSGPACGATLIAPNVAVTAAHCVLDDHATYAFGAGDFGKGSRVRVTERRIHPDFDAADALRKHDVALLVLERNVDFAEPAELADAEPSSGCNVQAIGYHAEGGAPVRVSAPACVMFRVTLGTDPIFEVHPAEGSALCIADGDEGSAVVAQDGLHTKLVGIYVGSVTQGITDCRRGTQFLDGYESIFGYRSFLGAR
jgi:hypothetical protein